MSDIYLKEFKCGRCGKVCEEFPALSRRDNKTEICSNCATSEALFDWVLSRAKEKRKEGE